MERRRTLGSEVENVMNEEYELLGEVDISKFGSGETLFEKDCNCSEIVLIWNDMVNGSNTASTVDVLVNNVALGAGRPKTAKSGSALNGYSIIKILEGIGCLALNSSGAISRTMYAGNTQAVETPYNLLPITDRIKKIILKNSTTAYHATGGHIKIYGR